MSEETLTLQSIEDSIAATIAPLKEQLSLVEGRERLILADLQNTREMKQRLLSTLRKLDPNMPGPGKKKAKAHSLNGGQTVSATTVETVRRYVDQIAADYPDGFTRSRVKEAMQAADEGYGDKRLMAGIEYLHESGYLTLHKIVTGGNKSYKRTEDLQ